MNVHHVGAALAVLAALAAPRASADDTKALLNLFDKAERLELISLQPEGPPAKGAPALHGWAVLGKTVVKDAEVRKAMVAALKKGLAESDGSTKDCFNPRHAIRVMNGGKPVDYLICFECSQVIIYADGKTRAELPITRSPQPVLDKVLRDAGVPLAKKPGK